MYGSVSRWRVKDGQQQEFEQLLNELMREMPPVRVGYASIGRTPIRGSTGSREVGTARTHTRRTATLQTRMRASGAFKH